MKIKAGQTQASLVLIIKTCHYVTCSRSLSQQTFWLAIGLTLLTMALFHSKPGRCAAVNY